MVNLRKRERKGKKDDEIVGLALFFKLIGVGDGGEMERLLVKKFLDVEIKIFIMGIEQQFGCFRSRHSFSIPK